MGLAKRSATARRSHRPPRAHRTKALRTGQFRSLGARRDRSRKGDRRRVRAEAMARQFGSRLMWRPGGSRTARTSARPRAGHCSGKLRAAHAAVLRAYIVLRVHLELIGNSAQATSKRFPFGQPACHTRRVWSPNQDRMRVSSFVSRAPLRHRGARDTRDLSAGNRRCATRPVRRRVRAANS